MRRMASESIVRLAGEASEAQWSASTAASLVRLLNESTDINARLVLESHLDGSRRVDVSIYGWEPPGQAAKFRLGARALEVTQVLGTEFDLDDGAPTVMGVFARAVTGDEPPIAGLPAPSIVAVSHRNPGRLRCIFNLSPDDIGTARAATRMFATLPWDACLAWTTQGAAVRLSIDVDEAATVVPGHAGLELFDTWEPSARLDALHRAGVSVDQADRAAAIWDRLPRIHQVRISPSRLPGSRLILGKVQARHSHMKLTASPNVPCSLKTYTASEWINAGANDAGSS